jgi:hypothetical protein
VEAKVRAATKLDWWDGLCVAALAAFGTLYALRFLSPVFHPHPSEDAAILMRYSQHLAQGHGIVWNIGDKPVDGATDFLFMVLIAGLARLGVSVESGVRLVTLVSHLATIVIVYLATRKLHGASRFAGLVTAGYLAMGPAPRYIGSGFGTPFFALSVCSTWWLANSLAGGSASLGRSLAFASSGLVMGLIRPEGALLAILMLLAVIYLRGLSRSRLALLCFVGTFALAGGAYFLWRWHYFGYPLPNPYYKKGGGHLYPEGLMDAVSNTIQMSLPFSLAYLLGLRSRELTKRTIFSLIPVVGFTGLWLLLSNEMNYLGRFQYPIVPVILMSWPSLAQGLGSEWRLPRLQELAPRSRAVAALLVAVMLAGIGLYQKRRYGGVIYFYDGRCDVAHMLSDYASKQYTMATTEAGLLPFYSGWRDLDTWGLNDPWIARNGGVTEAYLESRKPEVIMFHAPFSPLVPPNGSSAWFHMVMVLYRFAQKHGYRLAAAFGETPFRTHYYYVRPDFPESEAIVSRIRTMDYTWYANGKQAINYATVTSAAGRKVMEAARP